MLLAQQILAYLLLVAAGQGLVLGCLILFRRPSAIPHVLIGAFFIFLSLGCLGKVCSVLVPSDLRASLWLPLAYPLVYFPLVYLHLRFLAQPSCKWQPNDWLHFLPVFFFDFLSIFYLEGAGSLFSIDLISGSVAVMGYSVFYAIIFFGQLVYYGSRVRKICVNEVARLGDDPRDQLYLNWVQSLRRLFLVFWGSFTLFQIIGKQNLVGYVATYFIHLSAVVMIYWMGYRYLLRIKADFCRRVAVGTRRLSGESAAEPIIETLRASGLHRRKQITLAQTARSLGVPQKALSQAINDSRQAANFSDFINALRVEELKQRLNEPESRQLSLFGVSQEVGFSSKASFHRAFKKHCGVTPGEYLAKLSR